MTVLGATEFKATCLEVLERVRRTGEHITITRRGKPIAQLGPALSAIEEAPQKALHGTVEILGDIVGPAVPAKAWSALAGSSEGKSRSRQRE